MIKETYDMQTILIDQQMLLDVLHEVNGIFSVVFYLFMFLDVLETKDASDFFLVNATHSGMLIF